MILAEINLRSTPGLLYVRMLSSKGTSQSGQVLYTVRLALTFTAHLLGTGTIVHPKATIFAIAGPILIGANCIIEEAAIIVNRSAT